MFSVSAISITVLFGIYTCHLVLKIPQRHLVWKVSILFSSLLVSFKVSRPYKNKDRTRLLKKETLVFPLIICDLRYSLFDVSSATAVFGEIGTTVSEAVCFCFTILTVGLALLLLFTLSTLHSWHPASSQLLLCCLPFCCLGLKMVHCWSQTMPLAKSRSKT